MYSVYIYIGYDVMISVCIEYIHVGERERERENDMHDIRYRYNMMYPYLSYTILSFSILYCTMLCYKPGYTILHHDACIENHRNIMSNMYVNTYIIIYIYQNNVRVYRYIYIYTYMYIIIIIIIIITHKKNVYIYINYYYYYYIYIYMYNYIWYAQNVCINSIIYQESHILGLCRGFNLTMFSKKVGFGSKRPRGRLSKHGNPGSSGDRRRVGG